MATRALRRADRYSAEAMADGLLRVYAAILPAGVAA
jgi:hypothetical protein